MLLVVVMDVIQVFQQCYVVPMAVEAACFSGRVISFPVLLEIVTRQKSCQRKLRLAVGDDVRSNEFIHIPSALTALFFSSPSRLYSSMSNTPTSSDRSPL